MKICLFDGSLLDVRISERMNSQKVAIFFADLANLAHIRLKLSTIWQNNNIPSRSMGHICKNKQFCWKLILSLTLAWSLVIICCSFDVSFFLFYYSYRFGILWSQVSLVSKPRFLALLQCLALILTNDKVRHCMSKINMGIHTRQKTL